MRLIMSMLASRSSGFVGAKPKPHWPIVRDVTPNQPESDAYGSHRSWAS